MKFGLQKNFRLLLFIINQSKRRNLHRLLVLTIRLILLFLRLVPNLLLPSPICERPDQMKERSTDFCKDKSEFSNTTHFTSTRISINICSSFKLPLRIFYRLLLQFVLLEQAVFLIWPLYRLPYLYGFPELFLFFSRQRRIAKHTGRKTETDKI